MVDFEVLFDEASVRLSSLGEIHFHNAYDADEDFHLFRAEALFTLVGAPPGVPAAKDQKRGSNLTVPVVACKLPTGAYRAGGPTRWSWRVRFRPPQPGLWEVKIWLLARYPSKTQAPSLATKKKSLSARVGKTQKAAEFYELALGIKPDGSIDPAYFALHPAAKARFQVRDTGKPGPLLPPAKGQNPNYFHRSEKDPGANGRRRDKASFLMSAGRPWVAHDGTNSPSSYWNEYLSRENLLKDMKRFGVEGLPIWMSPWEMMLTHQDSKEHWPVGNGDFRSVPSVSKTDRRRGYMRFDQGRAYLLDTALDLAARYDAQVFLTVFTHQSLQESGHGWKEWGWTNRKAPKNQGSKPAHDLNGFRLFTTGSNRRLEIEEFFRFSPDGTYQEITRSGGKAKTQKKTFSPYRKGWKHLANLWRYIFGRWSASPALATWILIDELAGVGREPDWWWAKDHVTNNIAWHGYLIQLLKQKLLWQSEGWRLPYTGDLDHPFSTSTTHYTGTLRLGILDSPGRRAFMAKAIKERRREFSKPELVELEALHRKNAKKHRAFTLGAVENLCFLYADDKAKSGEFMGLKSFLEASMQAGMSFISHHCYPAIPSWGTWKAQPAAGAKPAEFVYLPDTSSPLLSFRGFALPNDSTADGLNSDRWLWDGLCARFGVWNKAYGSYPRIITEFGGRERDSPHQPWDQFGQRFPALAHFAAWSSLVQGHAGIPFKWCDGKELGEMRSRPVVRGKKRTKDIWSQSNYPVDNFLPMVSMQTFLKGIDMGALYPMGRFTKPGGSFRWTPVQMNASPRAPVFEDRCELKTDGLADLENRLFLFWIYDRKFYAQGQAIKTRLWVTKLPKKAHFEARFFDTWNGRFMSSWQSARSDAEGRLRLDVPTFPKSKNRSNIGRNGKKGSAFWDQTADGNDIAGQIRLVLGDELQVD